MIIQFPTTPITAMRLFRIALIKLRIRVALEKAQEAKCCKN